MNGEIQQKIKYILFLVILFFGIFWLYSNTRYLTEDLAVNPVSYDRFDVVVLGDSITEGLGVAVEDSYVSLLRDHTGVKIRNSGIRSDTTEDALERFEEDVLAYDPDIVVLLLGGNDFLQRVPEEETFLNLQEMIVQLQEKGIAVLLVGVPGGMFFDVYEDNFNILVEETGVEFVPNVLKGILGKSKYMKDPLHPNTDGHKLIFERIAPSLDSLLATYY